MRALIVLALLVAQQAYAIEVYDRWPGRPESKPQQVPEPASLALLGTGAVAALVAAAKRRRK